MPEIIVVAGASGSGKSFLAEAIRDLEPGVVLIKKKTNRAKRDYEDGKEEQADLIFDYSQGAFDDCEYRYNYAGKIYGFRKDDISSSLDRGESPVIIVRDSTVIGRLIEDFPGKVLVLFLRSAFHGEALRDALAQRGLADIEVEERLKRDELDIQQYVGFHELYDAVILNDYNPENLLTQARKQLYKFRNRNFVVKNYAFLIMPFDSSMDEEHNAIISAPRMSSRPQTHIERIDSIIGDYKINDKILACINKSEFVIADLSMERQNVYFELGYARGVGKEVFSVARRGTKLHFDIQNFRVEFYTGPVDLQRRVAHYLDGR